MSVPENKPPSRWRVAAIRHAIRIGRALGEKLPAIANDYRDGMTQPEIAEKYIITDLFGCRSSTARAAVSYALGGHEGGFGIGAYEGLIGPSELQQLEQEHRAAGGLEAVRSSKGTFARSPEQRKQDWRTINIQKGFTPWEEPELATACELSQLPEYHYQSGRSRGRVNNVLLAERLNEMYHGGKPVRTPLTVRKTLHRYRKRIAKP